MEDWQKEWWGKLEQTAVEVEEFFLDLTDAAESFADEVTETVEEFVVGLQEVIGLEVDGFIQDFLDVISEDSSDFEVYIWEDFEDFTDFADEEFLGISSQPATTDNNPACIDCANYHGKIYDGNLLVCAMHPYGWDDSNCPDWEGTKKDV